MANTTAVFPFTEIVGQDNMKRALMLNVIDPGIGGVLIKGEKGTAKSTTVRSMNMILPHIMGWVIGWVNRGETLLIRDKEFLN